MAMLKQLTINKPLIEALDQMSGYARFMKDLITKKRKADPGVFTISCKIRSLDVAKALYDLRDSVNMIPLAVCKRLGLEAPTLTNMQLVMADRLIKQSVGILHDVLVKVEDFILPADFVVLDCDVDLEIPIIFGRQLLATERVIVDMKLNELKFRLDKKEAKFKMHQPMSQQNDMNVFSVIDIFYDIGKGGSTGCLGEV
ncbi:uncharacterized protein LOC124896151 [Capsicum annuum]|uniref:uncharacterized protein LOC124896151 n=1 Tax=Capsicum annuum TaxID=4072 RepID=UPI001FB14D29|nr:uncharacterized protein LOC124896151 [Capsicum annuum]